MRVVLFSYYREGKFLLFYIHKLFLAVLLIRRRSWRGLAVLISSTSPHKKVYKGATERRSGFHFLSLPICVPLPYALTSYLLEAIRDENVTGKFCPVPNTIFSDCFHLLLVFFGFGTKTGRLYSGTVSKTV